MQAARVLVVATVPIIMFAATVLAVELRKTGKLNIPANIPLLVFSTDPTVQEVLSQDLSAARRGGATVSRSPMTLTVTVTDELLQPGASLGQLAPGDPQVAELIKAVPIRLNGVAPIARAISTAGGISFAELDEHFMIRVPFCAASIP